MVSRAQGHNHASKVGGNSGEAQIRGAERRRFEGGVQFEGETRKKAGEGSGEGTQ